MTTNNGGDYQLPARRDAQVERSFGGDKVVPINERAATAAAKNAQAMVQARYIMALQKPRNLLNVRDSILQACKRTRFAEVARYKKPQGGAKSCGHPGCPRSKSEKCHFVCGMSIRFADEVVKFMGNIDVEQEATYEDDDQRIVRVTATDLEVNLHKGQTVCIRKTIERRKPRKGQEIIGERQNSSGDIVYIVKASDGELATKEAALCAKVRRGLELQLLAQDIIDEATDAIFETLQSSAKKDPQKALKTVCDAFATLNLKPSDLEGHLGHSLSTASPAEIQELREIYTTIRDGQATWADYINTSGSGDDGDDGGDKPNGAKDKFAAGKHKRKKQNKPSDKVDNDKPPTMPATKANIDKMLVELCGNKADAESELGRITHSLGLGKRTNMDGMKPNEVAIVYQFVERSYNKEFGGPPDVSSEKTD